MRPAAHLSEPDEAPVSRIERLRSALEEARHLLPTQSPIKDFVHHNTLHAFQSLDFEEAVCEAADAFGANAYLPVEEYQGMGRTGKIKLENLHEEALRSLPEPLKMRKIFGGEIPAVDWVKDALVTFRSYPNAAFLKASLKRKGHATDTVDEWLRIALRIGSKSSSLGRGSERARSAPLPKLPHPILVRLIASYLDQGVSLWQFPEKNRPFFEAVGRLVRESLTPVLPGSDPERSLRYFSSDAEHAVMEALASRGVDPERWGESIQESLLEIPGWAGMVSMIEADPTQLREPVPIRLMDFLAVKLWVDSSSSGEAEPASLSQAASSALTPSHYAWVEQAVRRGIPPADAYFSSDQERSLLQELFDFCTSRSLAALWHRALETSTQRPLLDAIVQEGVPAALAVKPVAAAFCIDDRECSLRRYLEAECDWVSTHAVAGFFGVDFMFKGVSDSHPGKQCPVPVVPRAIVLERALKPRYLQAMHPRLWRMRAWVSSAVHSMRWGWFFAPLFAPWILLKTLIGILRPEWLGQRAPWRLFFKNGKGRSGTGEETDLVFLRDERNASGAQLPVGYTLDEMADRVESVLKAMSLSKGLSEIVLLVAHGSSSINNPHYSAYDCGACAGRPGAANARTFARMANLPEVRRLLSGRGLEIPERVWFVGALHDTCRDEVSYFDAHPPTERHAELFRRLKTGMESALSKNTRERIRRFALVPMDLGAKQAKREVLKRAHALFEPRPEMNHATNAFCVVARREWTRSIFMDRRAFLHCYDPAQDPDGRVLPGILGAVVPVCAGINLEYLFSRVDPMVYGSGSKLPHNVASLLGVMNGVDDDLRTGLPTQMTEIHDPVRLTFIVERDPESLHKLLQEHAAIREWFDLRWAFLYALHPESGRLYEYTRWDGFKPYASAAPAIAEVSDVLNWVHSSRENLPVRFLAEKGGSS